MARSLRQFEPGGPGLWRAPQAVGTASYRISESGTLIIGEGVRTGLARISLEGVGMAPAQSASNHGFGSDSKRWPLMGFERPGMAEWYVNSTEGLRQWFRVDSRPAGAFAQGLAISLRVDGPRPIAVTEDLIRLQGTSLSYKGIKAWDSLGRELPAELDAEGQSIILRVDDSAARYPVTIDPAWSQEGRFTAPAGQFGSKIGWSADVSGARAIFGATDVEPNGEYKAGAAFIFARTESGWVQEARLERQTPKRQDYFGTAVAIEGDTAVVTAPFSDQDPVFTVGSADVFTFSDGTWSHAAELLPPSYEGFENVGSAVDISGGVIALGAAPEYVGGVRNVGQVHFYEPDGSGGWNYDESITPADASERDLFGWGLSLDGNRLAASSIFDQSGGTDEVGSVYLFENIAGTWTEQSKILSPAVVEGLRFGEYVSLSGDNLSIHAKKPSNPGYFYRWNGSAWAQDADFNAFASSGNAVGYTGAVHGDTALLSSVPNNDVLLLSRASGSWQVTSTFPGTSGARGLALNGTFAAIGRPYDGPENAAYVYLLPPDIQSVTANPTQFAYNTTSTGTVTLAEPAPAGGIEVNVFASSGRGEVTPASVVVPGGQTSADFSIRSLMGDGSVSPTTAWNFRAIGSLFGQQESQTMTIIPAVLSSLKFNYNPTTYDRTISLVIRTTWAAPAGSGGWTIDLTSSLPATVSVPAQATIPEGSSFVVVPVTIVPGSTSRFISVQATLGGRGKTERLYLNP